MYIDAHCHAWEVWPYDPQVPDGGSRGRAEQVLWEMDRAEIAKAVVICAGIQGNPSNNEYVADVANRSGGRLVAFADVDSRWSDTHHQPGAPSRFKAILDRFSPIGITHYLDEASDPQWLLGAEADACFSMLAERGVILSLACGPSQIPAVARVAAKHSGLAILIHHLGRPKVGDRAAVESVLSAASAKNVYVKVSGFGYGYDPARCWDFPFREMQDVVRSVRDAYGANRMIWGSDYPVVHRFMTYRQSLEIVRSHCSFLDAAERAQVLGGTMAGLLSQAMGRRP